jgi:hypothetical protein
MWQRRRRSQAVECPAFRSTGRSHIGLGRPRKRYLGSQDNESINEIYNSTKIENEKFGEFSLGKKEFEIKNTSNYLIRLGLGGPEGYYGNGFGQIHFGIIQYNPKKVILFTVT